MKMRKTAVALVAAGMFVSLSACGTDSAQTGGSGRAGSVSAELTQANFSDEVLAAQQQVGSAHVEATVEFSGQRGTFAGDFAGSDDLSTLKMDMSAEMAGQHVAIRLVDKTIYLKAAGLSSDPAKPWVRVDLGDPANPLSSILDSANPANFSAYLKAVKSLEDNGDETVDGVQTRHYTVTVITEKMLKTNSMFKGRDVSGLGLPDQITSDVWVNEDNLPVKLAVSLGDTGSVEVHFSKYGEHVTVDAPPASEVSTFRF